MEFKCKCCMLVRLWTLKPELSSVQAKVAMRVHACADLLAPVAASITALAVRRLSGD